MGQATQPQREVCRAYAEDLLALNYTAICSEDSNLDTAITLICLRCSQPIDLHAKETPNRDLALPATRRMYQVWKNPWLSRRAGT